MTYRTFNPLLYQFVKYIFLPVLKRLYRIEAVNGEVFKRVTPPFIIVGNHTSFFDPLMVAAAVPHPVHYLTTDSVVQGALGFLIKMTGVISILKNRSDSSAIRKMFYLKEKAQVIGIFPEGQTTWDGSTGELYSPIGRLLKVMKVPVIAAVVKGSYHKDPKWGSGPRKGPIVVEYRELFSIADIKTKSTDELFDDLKDAITHDDLAYIEKHNLTFPSPRGGEYLERVLSWCPQCSSFASMKSEGNVFSCSRCGAAWLWRGDGYLYPRAGDSERRSIGAWLSQERAELAKVAPAARGNYYPADMVTYKRARQGRKRKVIAKGELVVDRTGFTFTDGLGDVRRFPFDEVQSSQVVTDNVFEFYHQGQIHEFNFTAPRTSGLKYLNLLKIFNPDEAELN